MSSGVPVHWLVGVAQRAGLAGADALKLPVGTPANDAWTAVCAAIPVRDGDLAQAVARHFQLAVADLSTAAPRVMKLLPGPRWRAECDPWLRGRSSGFTTEPPPWKRSSVHWGRQGADDYIRKPIDPARFVARIKAALRRAGA